MIINLMAILIITGLVSFLHGDTLTTVIHYSSMGFIGLGLLFFLGTSIGLLRFPDFYSRIHAAGKGDTLSSILILYGCAIYTLGHAEHLDLATILVGIKILIIINFIFIGSPTATHAIMNAGHQMGIKPWKNGKKS